MHSEKNQKAADFFGIALKTIEVLFGKLTDAIEPMGKVLMDAFENPQQAIKDLISGVFNRFITSIKGIGVVAEGVGIQIKGAFTLDWDEVQRGLQQTAQGVAQVVSGYDIEQQNAFVDGIVKAGTEAIETATKIETLRKEVKLSRGSTRSLDASVSTRGRTSKAESGRCIVSRTIEESDKRPTEALGEILDEQSQEELKLGRQAFGVGTT
jgi:hypothetical protein